MTELAEKALGYLQEVWAKDSDSAHDLGHIARVRENARRLAETEGPVDAEALDIACILHDLVNLPKDSPNRHLASRLSADKAVNWLNRNGFPAQRSRIVHGAIEAHSFSAGLTAQTREAKILQDADRLEALGAIGLARMFAVSGALGRELFDQDDPLAKNRALDDKAYALDHLDVKLFKLVETMQTETGRRIAKERAKFLKIFRDQLLIEIGRA